ncbi:MAG: chitinase, partial [Bacteroidia bacterium]|nr:chitinase [Bacteroidia bacterium]
MYKILATAFILLSSFAFSQIPNPALVGYWQNWNDANAPYSQLDLVDSRYNIIEVSFAVPQAGTDYKMEFIPDQVSQSTLITQIQALQSQGKKVLISMGGATAPISLSNSSERDTFVSTMNNIINTYGFDGIDIDFEGSSLSTTGGTISAPVDAPIINLIDAVKQIMSDYYVSHNKKLLLTMAPETAFVHGGQSAYGGIWGAYLPVIDALRDSLDILQVQLYNSGSMYGIDGNIYSQGTTDFIIAMTESIIQGFNTGGGSFIGLPANKIAIGLPACPSAAGG